MKINKLISTGIGELNNVGETSASYILKNAIRNNKLERTPEMDFLDLVANDKVLVGIAQKALSTPVKNSDKGLINITLELANKG